MLWIAIIIPLLIAWWVASDAKKRGYSQSAIIGWFLGVWMILIVFLPLYFILRSKPTTQASLAKGTYVCPYCGNLYQEKVPFCPYCGRSLEEDGGLENN